MREEIWGHIEDLETLNASALAPGSGVVKRIIFGPDAFWDDYVMRHFILPEGCAIPTHSHDWDHFVLPLSGDGEVEIEGKTYSLKFGDWVRVPGGTEHQFRNAGAGEFAFICIVPTDGDPHALKSARRAARK